MPNAFLGLIAEPVIITVAVASLFGVTFPRAFMILAQGVSANGFVFAWWLFQQSSMVIDVLCPWCLAVTVTTTLIFVALLKVNLLDGNFGDRARLRTTKLLTFYHVDWAFNIIAIAVVVAAALMKLI